MKVIFNYATRQFEPMEPSMRERFALGSKDPTPEVKTDGEVAGALMDAFPQQSFLQYQNAVDEGFQGTFEEFLQINSLDKSELDMQAIEGQTAGIRTILKAFEEPEPFENLFRSSDQLIQKFKKTKPVQESRDPNFSSIKRKKSKGTKLNQADIDKEKELTETFQTLANNPVFDKIIPKKFKNIKSITELSQSDFAKIQKDITDFKFKEITDERGLGPFSTLSERLKKNIGAAYKTRQKIKARPDFYSLDVAGDTFDLPYMTGLDTRFIKNLKKVYPAFKKIEANPTVDNYYKQIGKLERGEQNLIREFQEFLTGERKKERSLFESPKRLNLFKSLDIENKLSEETIELLKNQKGRTAANIFKQAKATKAAQKINLEQVNKKSIQRINEIYTLDPEATAPEVIDQYYGNAIKNISKKEEARMLKDLRNDVITYYKIISRTRVKPKGVELPSKAKVDDILTTIMESKGKDSFDIYGGYLRNIYSDIAESITKPGFKYDNKIRVLSDKFSGQHIDHSVGLSAVHEAAPGYVEAIQVIPKSVNKNKGILLERASTKIIDDFFTNTPNTPRKIGDKTYNTFEEKVDAFNNLSKQFANANNIDTPILRFGEPGKGPSPKETVKYFNEFTEGARRNMMEVWNNHGFVIYTNSRPMGSSFWTKTKPMKNMGGLISRVNFADGTQIDKFLAANKPNSMEEMETLKQAIASTKGGTELKNQFLYDTSPIGKLNKNIFGKDGDRNLMQQFNTQFLDPRSYAYYAQKFARGAVNIPELIFRFPFGITGVARDFITGETGKAERFGETMDPKLTRKIVESGIGDLLGISSAQIEGAEEKRTNPQKVTGEFLQFGAEIFGPATPYFLIKKFPKLIKQLRDLGASGTAVDKINKEIENKVAQQGVDQTRRDIVLSIGAGGAVAFLKYLGLDFLTKAPKAAKVTEGIVTQGGTPKYFFDFVGLIKSKGKDITDKAATLERQKVYDYNGYELTEDISTGKISIRKDTEGGASYYIGDGEYETVDGIIRKEEINYDPPETILDDAGKPKEVPDQYDEATLRPDDDGSAGDVDVGLDSIDDILDLLAKDGKKYSLDELEQMGINPKGLGEDLLKQILRNPEEIKLLDAKEMFKDTLTKVKYKIEKAGGGRVDFDKGGPTGLAALASLKSDKDADLKSDPVGIVMEGKPKSSEFDNVFLDVIEEFKEKANQPILYTDGTTYYPEYNVFVDREFNEVPGPSKGAIPVDERDQEVIPQKRLEAAGGGILKMAGDDSGPPPKSGPTPHGLPYVAKNVRPIKERK